MTLFKAYALVFIAVLLRWTVPRVRIGPVVRLWVEVFAGRYPW